MDGKVNPNSMLEKMGLNSQSSVVAILVAFALSLVLIAVPIRLYVRGKLISFGVDDATFYCAVIVSVFQATCVFIALHNGVGRADELLNAADNIPRLKALYASDMLYIFTLYLSKLSTATLVLRLTPKREHRYAIWFVISVATGWMVSSIFMLGFRCRKTLPWFDTSVVRCTDIITEWNVITAFDVITEAMLFSLSILLVWGIQMVFSSKALVVGAFAFRLPTIVASVLHLHFLRPIISLPASGNVARRLVPAISTAQLYIGYSLLSSVIPCIKNFMVAFDQPDQSQNLTRYGSSTDREELKFICKGEQEREIFRAGGKPVMYQAKIVGRRASPVPLVGSRPGTTDTNVMGKMGQDKNMVIKKGVEWSVDFHRLGRTGSSTEHHPGKRVEEGGNVV